MLTNDEKRRFYAVIMAGGGGTRLWPWSRKEHPKQMLRITGERSMFQITLDRLDGLIPVENIYVVTTAAQASALAAQAPEIPREHFLLEPQPRGTASVVGLAAITLQHENKNAVMAVLTADHYIKNESYFRELLSSAFTCAEEGHLVTLGIDPAYASTAMGYVEMGEKSAADYGLEANIVQRFTEKPDKKTAEEFIRDSRYKWNSGMFIWRADRIDKEIQKDIPDLHQKLDIIRSVLDTDSYNETISRVWPTIIPTTIDYGVMEKSDDVIVFPAHSLGWNDIGSWESIYGVLPEDENGNIHIHCKTLNIDSKGTLTCSETPEKLIVTVGMKDMIVVETEKVVLVCPKSETQRVRDIVNYLKEQNMLSYL